VERVFVAVLAGGNRPNTSLNELANQLPYWSGQPEIPFRFSYWVESGVRSQELARNRICKRFLASNADVLLMIDDDMVVSGWDSLRVLTTPDYDIAAPLQLMFDSGIDEATGEIKPAVKPCAFMYDTEADGYRQLYPAPGVTHTECGAVGGGMIAIRRRVLEDPKMLLAPDLDPPALFRTRFAPNYERVRGNDVDFCHRAGQCGYVVKVNWGARTGHLKTVDLYQVEVYAKQQFVLGYEQGVKDALSMAQKQSRPDNGEARGSAGGGEDNEGLAGLRLDRDGGPNEVPAEAGPRRQAEVAVDAVV